MNQVVKQVSIPELIGDVAKYMSFKKKYNLYSFFYRVSFGLFFYDKTNYYYKEYTKYMYRIERKYKRSIKNNFIDIPELKNASYPYNPNYVVPSAPPDNQVNQDDNVQSI